jgi:hypothetical protein
MLLTDLQPWMYTIIFGVLAALIIGNNICHLLRSIIYKESTSFTLIIGSVFGFIALLAAPVPFLKWLSVVPFLIDPGTAFSIYLAVKAKTSKSD